MRRSSSTKAVLVLAAAALLALPACASTHVRESTPTTPVGAGPDGSASPGNTNTGEANPGTAESVNPADQAPTSNSPGYRSVTTAPAQRKPAVVHTGIVATTFWVGEIFDPNASDGSQMLSTYDSKWFAHYGGCDGVSANGSCETEKRTAANGFFPTAMTPLENPFYLDVPFDDVNNSAAFAQRCQVVPWANDPGFQGRCKDKSFSYMKNHWVKLTGAKGQVCYGQVEDAGPGKYNDAAYVFGTAQPANKRYGGAGLDVSPALNGCLGFKELNGASDKVSWQFVDAADVPPGPWLKVVTKSPVS